MKITAKVQENKSLQTAGLLFRAESLKCLTTKMMLCNYSLFYGNVTVLLQLPLANHMIARISDIMNDTGYTWSYKELSEELFKRKGRKWRVTQGKLLKQAMDDSYRHYCSIVSLKGM